MWNYWRNVPQALGVGELVRGWKDEHRPNAMCAFAFRNVARELLKK